MNRGETNANVLYTYDVMEKKDADVPLYSHSRISHLHWFICVWLVVVSCHCLYCLPVTELLPGCNFKSSMSDVTARLRARECVRGLNHPSDLQQV